MHRSRRAFMAAFGGADDRLDAGSLPAVRMPNRAGFTAPDPRPEVP